MNPAFVACGLGALAFAAPVRAGEVDATAACAVARDASVEVTGDLHVFLGVEDEVRPGFRSGSGFFVTSDAVLTAHHVIARLDAAKVCGTSGCRDVEQVIAWPESDLALLILAAGPAGAPLKIGAGLGPGQPVIAAGFPGDVGYVCGPGNVVGETTLKDRPYWLFDGTVAAAGSSGGPVVSLGKRAVAIGAVSGATVVGDVRWNRAATLDAYDPSGERHALEAWRKEQPWTDVRSVNAKLPPGKAHWEDLKIPALADLEIVGPADGLCYGFYEAPTGLELTHSVPIAWTCDGQALRYTTSREQAVRIGLWTDVAAGFTGTVEFRRR